MQSQYTSPTMNTHPPWKPKTNEAFHWPLQLATPVSPHLIPAPSLNYWQRWSLHCGGLPAWRHFLVARFHRPRETRQHWTLEWGLPAQLAWIRWSRYRGGVELVPEVGSRPQHTIQQNVPTKIGNFEIRNQLLINKARKVSESACAILMRRRSIWSGLSDKWKPARCGCRFFTRSTLECRQMIRRITTYAT